MRYHQRMITTGQAILIAVGAWWALVGLFMKFGATALSAKIGAQRAFRIGAAVGKASLFITALGFGAGLLFWNN